MKNYKSEREGQIAFFEDLRLDKDVRFQDNTDGVIGGALFEFKLAIKDINKVLFQAIKYLSRMRIKGKSVPAHILLCDLNKQAVYYFNSIDFLKDIEKVYIGSASKNNDTFHTNQKPKEEINTNDHKGVGKIYKIIEDKKYTQIHIDENCVIGWAERFYNENPKATKKDFFNEIKNPHFFKDFIYKWQGIENDFKYIMDCLNDKMHRKELGAFFTPKQYCQISADMIRNAIKEIPQDNDYIILDRCYRYGQFRTIFYR